MLGKKAWVRSQSQGDLNVGPKGGLGLTHPFSGEGLKGLRDKAF